jgi:hypothetical protein
MLGLVLALSACIGAARADLVGYWTFDGDATATVGVDGQMFSNDFMGISATTDRNGMASGALAFDGDYEEYVSIADGGGLNGAQAGTVSMWVKWTGEQDASGTSAQWGYGAVLARQGVTPAGDIWSESVIRLSAADPAGVDTTIQWVSCLDDYESLDGTASPAETWHHVAVVFQGDYLGDSTLYVDGVAQSSATLDAMARLPAETPLTVGGWIGGSCFSTSSIDDVAVFNDMLTETQIGELYAQTRTPLDVGAGTTPDRLPLAGVTASASSYFGGSASWGSRHPYFACNGIGRETDSANGLGAPTEFYDTEATSHRGMWLSNGANDPEVQGGGTPWIEFDLGSEETVYELVVWNYNEPDYTARGIQSADIYYSANGFTWTLFGTETFTEEDAVLGDVTGQSVDLGASGITARYFRFENLANFGDDYYGLNEVDFYLTPGETPPPIPGDTNNDRIVDEEDARVLATNWGSTVSGKEQDGDFNGDDLVNALDAAILAANWGDHTGGESSVIVPEPSMFVLLLSLLPAFWRRRR